MGSSPAGITMVAITEVSACVLGVLPAALASSKHSGELWQCPLCQSMLMACLTLLKLFGYIFKLKCLKMGWEKLHFHIREELLFSSCSWGLWETQGKSKLLSRVFDFKSSPLFCSSSNLFHCIFVIYPRARLIARAESCYEVWVMWILYQNFKNQNGAGDPVHNLHMYALDIANLH